MRFTAVIIAAAAVVSAAAMPAPTDAANPPTATKPGDASSTHPAAAPQSVGENVEVVQWDGVPTDAETVVDLTSTSALEKRAIPAVIVGAAGIIGSTALTDLTTRAIKASVGLISNLNNWNSAREGFTRTTTREMFNRNPDRRRWKAAVCYNKGYAVKDRNNVAGFRDAKFSLGPLNTDYDCMYLGAGNAFYTHAEGGYINLSYTYQRGACTFDGKTGDLSC
ncbi:uncharacterized protein EAE97_006828 [Neofusicoccum parvum]|uniref:Uncharacterized protein EAE97_006828 n=1 Tax=Neofusicoccum parvum TaxID=310453 RepID=A0ACB5S1F1_9PEZI|nr:uncharacterized protein EAE97_006828 [Neofusicoccum parvum]